jgi:hypothetical protein
MWFYSLVLVVLIVFNGLAYFYNLSKVAYIISLFFLVIIAAFRPSTCCADYSTYVDYYNNLSALPLTFLEPSYFIIAAISKFIFHGPLGIFIIYSILGVCLKGMAFVKLTKYYSVSLILYFCSFYLLHEMTQIRVGVASAILLLSIPSIVDKKPKFFFLCFVLGCLFHYSYIAFGLFYFLDPKKINPWLYIGVIFFAFVAFNVGFSIVSIVEMMRIGFLSDKITAYKMLLDSGFFGDIQLINPLLFFRIAVLTALLFNWKFLLEKNRFSVILIKVYAFSIFFFVALADLPALAGRLNQLFGIVEVVIITFVIYILTPRYISVVIAILFAILIFYKQLYYSDLMQSYF